MPRIAHKRTAYCNRVLPRADLVSDGEGGKGALVQTHFEGGGRSRKRSSMLPQCRLLRYRANCGFQPESVCDPAGCNFPGPDFRPPLSCLSGVSTWIPSERSMHPFLSEIAANVEKSLPQFQPYARGPR